MVEWCWNVIEQQYLLCKIGYRGYPFEITLHIITRYPHERMANSQLQVEQWLVKLKTHGIVVVLFIA